MTHSRWSIAVALIMMAVIYVLTPARAAFSQQPNAGRVSIQNSFFASGWIGDGEYDRKYIEFSGDRSNPRTAPDSMRITYTFGPMRFGGMFWQNHPDNWGDRPGNDYSGRRFSKVTFWARGATGGEVVEFKAGGIDHPQKKHRDSFTATLGRVRLNQRWTQYQIDVSGADLRSVIGGFAWVSSSDYNPRRRIVFFIDDVVFE